MAIEVIDGHRTRAGATRQGFPDSSFVNPHPHRRRPLRHDEFDVDSVGEHVLVDLWDL